MKKKNNMILKELVGKQIQITYYRHLPQKNIVKTGRLMACSHSHILLEYKTSHNVKRTWFSRPRSSDTIIVIEEVKNE